MKPDEDDYRAFVEARYARLVRAAVLFGSGEQDAEDAVQETLIRCYSSWGRVSAANDRDAYVYRVLVNGISRSRRRRWRGEIPYEKLPEPSPTDDPATEVSLSHTIRASLDRLTQEQRQVLVLRYFADLTEAQIATVLALRPERSRAERRGRSPRFPKTNRSADLARSHEEK